MNNNIIDFIGLIVIGVVLCTLIICQTILEYKDKSKLPQNFHYRIKRSDNIFVEKWYAEIYTIVPYGEKKLMHTEDHLSKIDAENDAKSIIAQFESYNKNENGNKI